MNLEGSSLYHEGNTSKTNFHNVDTLVNDHLFQESDATHNLSPTTYCYDPPMVHQPVPQYPPQQHPPLQHPPLQHPPLQHPPLQHPPSQRPSPQRQHYLHRSLNLPPYGLPQISPIPITHPSSIVPQFMIPTFHQQSNYIQNTQDFYDVLHHLNMNAPICQGNPRIKIRLEDEELWRTFYENTNEMILTKTGRRMYPQLRIQISGLEERVQYGILLRMRPLDQNKYKYNLKESAWLKSGKGEVSLPFLAWHPDMVQQGEDWMSQPVSFEKIKITNNFKCGDRRQLILHSQQKYRPQILIVEKDYLHLVHALSPEQLSPKSYELPFTDFISVTAYQNRNLKHLKIENNAYARGFRKKSKENYTLV